MKNSFSFFHFDDQHTVSLPVVTDGDANISNGEIIYMNSGKPTPLATASATGLKRYLVAEKYVVGNKNLVAWNLDETDYLVGLADDDCVVSGRYEINASKITTGDTNKQVEIIKILKEGTDYNKVLFVLV